MSFSLSGLASGLDTATLIKQLVELEKQPIYREEARVKTFTSQQSVFRNINTKLMTLRTAAADLKLGANFKLTSATNSNDNVAKVTASESALKGDYAIEVDSLAKAHVMRLEGSSGTIGTALQGTITIYNENLKTEDKSLSINIDTSDNPEATYEDVMKQIANAINSKDAGVTASVIETEAGKTSLVLTSAETGEAHSIQFDNSVTGPDGSKVTIKDESGIFNAISAKNADNQPIGFVQAQQAENAVFTVNGVSVTRSTNTVSDVIQGVTISLVARGETTVNVARDADKVADKVKAFVDAYNDVMKTIRDNTRKLDSNATTKNLQGDSTLRSLQSALSDWSVRRVDGTIDGYHLLSDIGIEADKGVTVGSSMTGQLSFNRELFIEKFNENPEAVFHMFGHDDTSDANRDGFARIFDEALPSWTSSVDGIIQGRIKGYDSQISDTKERIERLENSLLRKEEQLKRQFTAMEVALSQLQSQQAWMTSQLASLSTSYY
ncbi:flagellar hook-associated protein 2 [Xylanibacillus composti]|uniref:Flagellar hook-associated protein 2 n=1 Tax=Xylanibacillus composti TaxID=1572762 RepID=A0A8J4H2X8_9BACL|nr:flagellar filament capping protein FliD [Xylanibacillus composti]GIQ69973.1 flagellar hook-associated protein 2 [Xylanibacillus composti]